jgi:N-carbamoyl-L-amino-acid hydrolase
MSPTNTLEVNAERLWATIERSAEIGRFRDTGLRRLRPVPRRPAGA